MKYKEKLQKLQTENFSEWMTARAEVEDKISKEQTLFCVCKRLATGLHEMSCRKFKDKVNRETVEKLAHLLTHKV